MLLQLFLSRQREYAADETGVRMVGQPYGLISALQKLGHLQPADPDNVNFALDLGSVHREAVSLGGGAFFALQHTSSAGEAH